MFLFSIFIDKLNLLFKMVYFEFPDMYKKKLTE